MTTDLTPAEQAAARELTTPECPWHEGCDGTCEAAQDYARAVVAAVRPHIEADALDALADAATVHGPPSADHLRGIAFTVRQGRKSVRDWLAGDTTEESR